MAVIEYLPNRVKGLLESLKDIKVIAENEDNNRLEDLSEFSVDCNASYYTDSIDSDIVGMHLINIMPEECFENDVYYSDILCAAKNIATKNGTQEQFIDLLQKKCKRNVRRDWFSSEFPRDKYSEKAIAEIIKEEYPHIYAKWHTKWIEGTMNEIFSRTISKGGKLDIEVQTLADLFYKFFWLDYIFIDDERGAWYEVRDNILTKHSGVIDDMYSRLMDKSRIWRITHRGQKIQETAFKIMESDFHDSNFRLLFTAFYRTIKNNDKIGQVKETLKNKFRLRIRKEMNNDPERMLWANGKMTVATTKRIEVVKPHIEDLYDMTTGCDLPDRDEVPSEDLIEKLDTWLTEVYPEGTHNFALVDWAGFLRGGNPFKLLRCYTGAGSNSKSCIMELLRHLLGSYCVPTNISVLMSNLSGGATTELAKAIKTRLLIINETSSSQTADAEQIKQLTGDDFISFREIYGKSQSSKIFAKIVVVCNEIFKINNADTATQRRFEVHSHLARWVNDPANPQYAGKKYIHKINHEFSSQIKQLAPVLAWKLVYHEYSKYVEWLADSSARKLPPLFQSDQRSQWIKVCELSGFVQNFVVKTGNQEDSVKMIDIIGQYNYHRRRGTTAEIDILKDKISALCFPDAHIVDDVLYGYKVRQQGSVSLSTMSSMSMKR